MINTPVTSFKALYYLNNFKTITNDKQIVKDINTNTRFVC